MSLENYVTSNCFISWNEVVVSKDHPDVAGKILLNTQQKESITLWVQSCADPWRLAHPKIPLIILSGVRSPELNQLVGGTSDSDHLHACAFDCFARNMSSMSFFCSILEMGLPHRQLILYTKSNFVHWSINVPGRQYKNQIIIKEA